MLVLFSTCTQNGCNPLKWFKASCEVGSLCGDKPWMVVGRHGEKNEDGTCMCLDGPWYECTNDDCTERKKNETPADYN